MKIASLLFRKRFGEGRSNDNNSFVHSLKIVIYYYHFGAWLFFPTFAIAFVSASEWNSKWTVLEKGFLIKFSWLILFNEIAMLTVLVTCWKTCPERETEWELELVKKRDSLSKLNLQKIPFDRLYPLSD